MLKIDLFPRPWSCHAPRVPGFEPMISHRITNLGKPWAFKWRCEVLVDDVSMFMSHHETKGAAESKAAAMMKAYTETHYVSK